MGLIISEGSGWQKQYKFNYIGHYEQYVASIISVTALRPTWGGAEYGENQK